jgi:hypothetical protein
MNEDAIPQFFTPDVQNQSIGVRKVMVDGMEELESSQIRARSSQDAAEPQSSLAIDGIPGIPFEAGISNPDVFSQGEDIIYDIYLFHAGLPVAKEDYDILASVKTSPRAKGTIWSGKLEAGIYPTRSEPGYFELWIPSAATENLYAGTYYVDIMIQERFGSGKGRFDRKYVLLKSHFNIDYTNFSPNPEGRGSTSRAGVEATWPNAPSTVGSRRNIESNYYIDPT